MLLNCVPTTPYARKLRKVYYYPIRNAYPARNYYSYYDFLSCKSCSNSKKALCNNSKQEIETNQADQDALELAMLLSFQEVSKSS